MTSSPVTAHLSAAAPALERYLRRATAGLPPAKRQEVWDELEEHVYARAEQLEWQGASPEQALACALAELGSPLRVSAAMNGVHNMPKLIAFGGAAALVLSAAFYALAQNPRAFEVPLVTDAPPPTICAKSPPAQGVRIVGQRGDQTCFEFTNPQRGTYISLNKLKEIVVAQGGQAGPLNPESWRLTFPRGGRVTSITTRVNFTRNGESYTDVGVLMRALQGSRSPIVLRGFRAPLIEAGPVSLQLSGPGASQGEELYQEFGISFVDALMNDSFPQGGVAYGPVRGNAEHTVKTKLPAGEVVMLLTAEYEQPEPHVIDNTGLPAGTTPPTSLASERRYAFSFAEVQPGGTVTLKANSPQLVFHKDPSTLTPSIARVPALLVQVTNVPLNDLRSGIFVPAEPTSDAR